METARAVLQVLLTIVVIITPPAFLAIYFFNSRRRAVRDNTLLVMLRNEIQSHDRRITECEERLDVIQGRKTTPPDDNNPPSGEFGGPTIPVVGILVAASLLFFGGALAYAAYMPGGLTMAKVDVSKLEAETLAAWQGGNAVLAERKANELAEADPDSGVAYHVRGLAFEQAGRQEDAHEQYSAAAKKGYVPAINRLAYFAYRDCHDCGEASP